jgi:iron complex transport system substrate-binding protein
LKFLKWGSLLVVILWSCQSENKKKASEKDLGNHTAISTNVSHAQNFEINKFQDYTVIKVKNAWKNAEKTFTYALVQNGDVDLPDSIIFDQVIITPVDKLVSFSTTHIPYLDMLGVADRLVGFPNTDYISTPGVRSLIDSGMVTDLGSENNPNLEKIITLSPDLVMAYGMPGGSDLAFKLKQAGIPVIYNADYMELSPLGRAEWIKFMAAFFHKEQLADSLYQQVMDRYSNLKEVAALQESTPTVLSGIVYGDAWFMPAGKNYGANFFEDANAEYLWGDNDKSGYLELSFEAVYQKAYDADFWIGVGTYQSLDALADADARYKNFEAFHEKNVYNYMARKGPKGGNEYFETGYAKPDIILADLIKIFHPDALPDHQLYFHEQLK